MPREMKKGREMMPRICGKNVRIRRDNAEGDAEKDDEREMMLRI